AGSMLVSLPEHLIAYEVLMVLGQALVGLVGSCNGALVSTRVDPDLRGRAAGFVNAANLGAAVLGGGLFLTIFNSFGVHAGALSLVAMIVLPSLVALSIAEPPPLHEPLGQHVLSMIKVIWSAIRSRKGWTGLLFCISPVGTVALGNLFSALYLDYHVSPHVVELVNGYMGGFVTAAGALISGFFLDRINRRHAYLAAGVLTALCAGCMALFPFTPLTFVVGALVYLAITGLAYAAFSAFVYEIVGDAGKTASTLYSVFPMVGNQAVAYMVLVDGLAHDRWGTKGMLLTDAGLNLAGVVALSILMWVLLPKRSADLTAMEQAPVEPEEVLVA
ncbi:MAG: MFS transporter, partial [Candidatus Xenobia bacterium]